MRVVVIEDGPDLAFMLAQRLRLDDPDVEVVTITADFEHAVANHPWHDVDIAVVDIMLPRIDGRTIAYWLHTQHPNVRVLVWSALPQEQLLDIAADKVIVKQDIDGLVRAIRDG